MMKQFRWFFWVMVGVTVLATACGGEELTPTAVPRPTTPPPNTPLPATETAVPVATFSPHKVSPTREGARSIFVIASQYVFGPEEIKVKRGENITVRLSSTDTLHDFVIDELDAYIFAPAQKEGIGGFQADSPGTYTFYCSIPGHRESGMEGTLIVEDP